MNIATSELSLYQLTQDLDEPLASLSVGAETLKYYVSSIIDLLIEEQIRATVWVKLPQTQSWINQIRRLQQEGNVEQIFVCNNRHLQLGSALQENAAKTPIAVKLHQSQTLQRECCLIVSGSDFCSLVVAQWQKSKIQIDNSGKRLQQPYLKMVSSFAPQEIRTILAEIKQNIVLGSSQADEAFAFDLPAEVKASLFNKLITLQVSQQEKVQTALNIYRARGNNQPAPTASILSLQENFLNDLVQELRSPITHIKTALSLLESKQIKGEQRQLYLQMLSSECDRQNSLVNGLLGLLQLETPAEAEYLRLDDLVPGIVSTYQPLAEEKEIQLGYTIPANLPPISCPKSWFRQIIINLLNNSLQFTPAKGKVFVQASFKKESQQIEILVTDTGVGIPSKEINRIFDGFYRTKPSDKSQSAGAGLGLTLVKQSVQRSGGEISVTSQPNKGTVFKILMPAVPPELV
ncbi:MAG: signal transduction histidine kinase [Hyellaceae cyanobacterium CSU_1_1]|nr:signal transduction histidine kinase [Pleurocapsa sp. CRU_1_2]NJR46728.1 signal transduction histidine kinase [Hyellaceae cyanobacterium CSU_1_1]